MPIRRILLILLAVAVIAPVGLFIRHEWNESQVCKREFGSEAETSDYEICTEYGANPGLCGDPALQPFRCSEDFIARSRTMLAARDRGLYQARQACAAGDPAVVGTRCSPEQWDHYCTKFHASKRSLPRCRAAGPDGPEGVPPAEFQARVSAPAGPQSGPRPGCGTLTAYELPGAAPSSVAVDDDGSVWFTERGIGTLSHMTVTGQVTRRFLPAEPGALARAPGGDLWFADRAHAIWQVVPGGEARRHPVPTATGAGAAPMGQAGGGPSDLTVTTDGTVWFVESEADQIRRITPDGTITELPLTRPGDGFIRPSSVSAGPDGSVWVSAPLGNRLARVNGRTLSVTHLTVKRTGGTVVAHSVAADAAGNAWFSQPTPSAMDPEPSRAALGRMDRTGSITLYPLPGSGPRWPASLTAGPDGAIWFLDAPAKTVGRMAADGTVTEFAAPGIGEGGTFARQLAAGPNSLWFAQPHTNSLGLITCRGGMAD